MKKIMLITTTFMVATSCAKNSVQDVSIDNNILPKQFLQSDSTSLISVEHFWKMPFDDKQLTEIVDIALKNNYSLKIACQNIQKAKSFFKKTQSEEFPDLNFDASSQTARYKTDGEGDKRDSTHSVGLNLSWELDLWGRLARLSESELQKYQATEQDLQAAALLIASNTIELYLNLGQVQEEYRLQTKIFEIYKQKYQVSQKLYNAGNIDFTELNSIKYDYDNSSYNLSLQKKKINDLKSGLAILLGVNVKDLLQVDKIDYKNNIKFGNVNLSETRPDLIAAEKRILSSIAKTKAVELERLPSLKVDLVYALSASSVSEIYKTTLFNSLIGLNIPIFRAGEISQNINIAKSEQEIAMLEYLSLSNKIVNETVTSYKKLENYTKALNLAKDKMLDIEEILIVNKKMYKAGSIDYIAFLDYEQQKVQGQIDYNLAQKEYLQSILNVYRSIGGMKSNYHNKGTGNEE